MMRRHDLHDQAPLQHMDDDTDAGTLDSDGQADAQSDGDGDPSDGLGDDGSPDQPGEGDGAGVNPVSVSVSVALVTQPTDMTCWAASIAMVAGARDGASYSAEEIAAQAGMDIHTWYGWSQIQNAAMVWGLGALGPACAMPQLWADQLTSYGPLWIVKKDDPHSPGHAVVLAAIEGDGTIDGTSVTLYNPWPSLGVETKAYKDFEAQFELASNTNAEMLHG